MAFQTESEQEAHILIVNLINEGFSKQEHGFLDRLSLTSKRQNSK